MLRFKPTTLLLTAALALPLGNAAMAKDAPCEHDHPHKHHHHRHANTPELIKALFASWELSDEQLAQLDTARAELKSQAKELRDEAFEDRQAKRDAWRSLRDEHRQSLDEVLSDEQLAVLELLMDSRRHHKASKS